MTTSNRDLCVYSKFVLDLAREFDCTITVCSTHPDSETNNEFSLKGPKSMSDFEVNNNTLYVWGFTSGDSYIYEIHSLYIKNPQIDTLFIGNNVKTNDDLHKIHDILRYTHNTIKAFKNIKTEYNLNFQCIDGLLIDKRYDSVIEYAPDRTNRAIVIPDGIKSLKEHCFNYNEYVNLLVLPSTIQSIEGIKSLPNLENVVVKDAIDTEIYSMKGALYEKATNKLYFIPPHNRNYPSNKQLQNLLAKIHSSLQKEIQDGKWPVLSSESLSLSDGLIRVMHDGGFYEQIWTVNLHLLPAKITLNYIFVDLWTSYCKYLHNFEDIIEKNYCSNCPVKTNCSSIYHSNDIYVSHLIHKLNEIGLRPSDEDEFEYILDLDTPIDQMIRTISDFFDLALTAKEKYMIVDKPANQHFFTQLDLDSRHSGDTQSDNMTISKMSEYFPFDYIFP